MTKIKVSLIGHGHLGKWHAQKIQNHKEIEFIGIADRFCKENSLKKLYPDLIITEKFEDLIDHSDAFIIATPTNTHFEICKKLILKKKHVFCEKPVCTNSAESRELLKLVDEFKTKFFVGHSERCHEAWEMLNFKEADSILFERFTMPKNRAYDVSVVEDLMVHDIDLFHYLFSYDLACLEARGTIHHTGLLDEVEVDLKTTCGKKVKIKSNRNCKVEKRLVSYKLQEQEIKVDLLNLQIIKKQETIELNKRDHLLIEQNSFYENILSDKKPLTSLMDGHKAMKTIDAIHQSIFESREIFIN